MRKFDAALLALVHDLQTALTEHRGLGLAAPQIGSNLSVFVTAAGAYVNPRLELSGGMISQPEECLSLPNVRVSVPRYVKAVIHAQNEHGVWFEEAACGLVARVWQHEVDHLKGVLITDYLSARPAS